MPTIYDNIENRFKDGLLKHFSQAKRVDCCAGYFNITGWNIVNDAVEKLEGMEVYEDGVKQMRYCRVLVGMEKPPQEMVNDGLFSGENQITNDKAARYKKQMAENFRMQLEHGIPSNQSEKAIQKLLAQLKSGRVIIKLFLRHPLHAKLYLSYSDDDITPKLGMLGSSNFTFSGLQNQGELNIDVLEQDAAGKLAKWFDKMWSDRWCFDITAELIKAIEESWAREDILKPYYIYLKIAYHLSREARSGLGEFNIPREFKDSLLDFQQKAVLIAAHHLNKRNGVIVGDVVGLGKTITAAAIAKIVEDDLGYNTLILCPKNLVEMWQDYVERYGLHARVISHSMITRELPELRRYRLVVIDESHNFRNHETVAYKALKSYLEENGSKVLLLTATPYNKSYEDLANQLKLFIPEDYNLGIFPEAYINQLGGVINFNTRHENIPVWSINAFAQSPCADDWRELMRYYMVRRTRSFIKQNYALKDLENGRLYLEFNNGTRSYFPERIPKKALFSMQSADSTDQYAKLYDNDVVMMIDNLILPRYSMYYYLDNKKVKNTNTSEKEVIANLSRAGLRTRGFCRTNLYKRLESSGYSFLLSVSRLILRNYLTAYAAENGFDIPIGGSGVLSDIDSAVFSDTDEYFDKDFDADILPENFFGFTKEEYKRRAGILYGEIVKNQKKRFTWVRADLFNRKKLVKDLVQDNKDLLTIFDRVDAWDANQDRKLAALEEMICKTHPDEKLLIFTQFADTANYLGRELEKRGIRNVGVATGDSNDITDLVKRFSPVSNHMPVRVLNELRVMISTDVLSEGQNLQDSHIIVNFDLPWALIRLIQRAGRVDRIGQTSDQILCYSFLPEDGVENILNLRSKLRRRIKDNAEVVGSDEVFFDGDPVNIADLYNEKSGIFDDDEEDSEVDLASYAYQIWKNATDARPELKKIIPSLPNVVFSTKTNTVTNDKDSVIVYTRTKNDNDVLSWMDEKNMLITNSQFKILKAAACTFDTPALERMEMHHEIVKQAMIKVSEDEYSSATGTLGRKTGVKYRAYVTLQRFIDANEGTFFCTDVHKQALNDIYNYPLKETARDILSRQLKAGLSDHEFADIVIGLKEENRLCITDTVETESRAPQIICSLGMRKAEKA